MARSHDFAMGLMLRDQFDDGYIYDYLEGACIWRFYKNGRDPALGSPNKGGE